MAWKDIPGFGKKKDSSENVEKKGKENEENSAVSTNDSSGEEEGFPFEEGQFSEDINPRNKDLKERNKKLVLFMGVGLVFLAGFVYLASKSRTPAEKPKKEKPFVMDAIQESDDIRETTVFSSLKRELEEVKKERTNKLEESQLETIEAKASSNSPPPSTIVSGTASLTSNSGPAESGSLKKGSSYPPLPPPDNLAQGEQSIIFPDSIPQGKRVASKPKYKVVVVDIPFQSASFASSNVVAYKDVSVDSVENGLLEKVDSPVMAIGKPDKNVSAKGNVGDSISKSKADSKDSKSKSKTFTIPAGSFFKVILLNGVDAPTGMGGKANPYPVIARVLTDSVLPNRFFADMKGCFVLGEATGELSSERVVMRFTKISCVTRTGKVIEKNITGFIAGEDGKYGLIGRVVSKAGAQLGRVLLAKFVESAGNIMTTQSQVLSTSGLGTVSTIKPDKAGEAAVYGGLAGAAKSLSDYYLNLADQIFPIIEINAGRQGDVVLLRNLTIDLDKDLKDNGGFIQRAGVLSESPESKVFKIKDGD